MNIRKKRYVRGFLILILGGVFLIPDVTFAASSVEQSLLEKGEIILKLLSWLWVVPAIIAGQLMTNDFVYGSFIHLEPYLWQMWTYMRMIANYILGFLFIGSVLKQFFSSDETGKLFDVLKKTVIAAILIQMSWFLIGAMVDFSIIMTAAVASIPEQVMEKQFDSLKTKMATIKRVNISASGVLTIDENADNNVKYIDNIDVITPKANTVSGPLIFMGASVLKLFQYKYIDSGEGKDNVSASRNLRDLTIGMTMKILVIVLISLPLIILMIVNAIRIFWIWIWVILSPLLVLDIVFNGVMGEKNKAFKLGNFLGLIFQPVAVVGMISLGLILVIGVRDVLVGGKDYERETLQQINVYPHKDNSSTIDAGSSSITINGDFFKDLGNDVGGVIGQLILMFFTMFLFWALVKVGFASSEITSGIANSMYSFATKSMKLIPIPLPGLNMGVSALKHGYNQTERKATSLIEGKQYTASDNIMKKLGLQKGGSMTAEDFKNLQDRITSNIYVPGSNSNVSAKSFWSTANELAKKVSSLGYNGYFKQAVDTWMTTGGGFKYLQDKGVVSKSLTYDKLSGNKAALSKVHQYINAMMTNGFTDKNLTSLTVSSDISTANRGKG